MSDARKLVIATVEDDESMRLLLERILVNAGYDARPFYAAAPALEWPE